MPATPLDIALNRYIGLNRARFHTPGHKGQPDGLFGTLLSYDLSEVDGTDNLLDPRGAIAQTEARLSGIYKSEKTIISAGGATLCVQTMLALSAVKPGGVIIGRNAHVSAVNAMALLGLEPVWIYPCDGRVCAKDVDSALESNADIRAVFITSPDYYGRLSDIAAISRACKRFGVPLLVDNAHGSHLKFLRTELHPISQGADMVGDSLHKTMPVLTGGALLHVNNPAFAASARQKMNLFRSTSPNYLIMLSIDRMISLIENGMENEFAKLTDKTAEIREYAAGAGFSLPEGLCDPVRISLYLRGTGYGGGDFARLLRENGVEPEFCSDDGCVLIPSIYSGDDDYDRLKKALAAARPLRCARPAQDFHRPLKAMSLREAVLAQNSLIYVDDAVGAVAASSAAICPPGIPIVAAGELIDENIAASLKSNGVFTISVVK